jgi:hypothetical protein
MIRGVPFGPVSMEQSVQSRLRLRRMRDFLYPGSMMRSRVWRESVYYGSALHDFRSGAPVRSRLSGRHRWWRYGTFSTLIDMALALHDRA